MMRAKLWITSIEKNEDESETLNFSAVAKNDGYDESGNDENNTYAKWTPMAEMKMLIQNPDLWGKFERGQEFYLDFTPVK